MASTKQIVATVVMFFAAGMMLLVAWGQARNAGPSPEVLAELELQVRALMYYSEFARAERVIEDMIELEPNQHEYYYLLAVAQTRQGKADPAFASLEKAIEKGFDDYNLLNTDSNLTFLRSDARFNALLQEVWAKSMSAEERAPEPAPSND